MQPENPRADTAGIAWAITDMSNHVAAFDEQFAVECDADRSPGALAARDRRNRPALDGLDLRDLARGHDDDLVPRAEAAGFDASGDNAAGGAVIGGPHRRAQPHPFQTAPAVPRAADLGPAPYLVPVGACV